MKWRFEYVMAFALLAVLTGAMTFAFAVGDKETANMLVVALVGAFGSLMSYMFTKHNPSTSKDDKP